MKRNPLWKEPLRWLNSPMIFGPTNPPMLAVQLIKPIAAAAAEVERSELVHVTPTNQIVERLLAKGRVPFRTPCWSADGHHLAYVANFAAEPYLVVADADGTHPRPLASLPVQISGRNRVWRRVIIEKPFGMNEDSARTLNREVQASFDESQIYRIDHYLGKESVQNLMVFRFANTVLEPLWNRNFIDHVQITVAESIGIEYRAGYYEQAGALRDMIQSHLMQVMALVAMEPPVELGAGAVRDEKLKVLRAIRPFAPEDIARHTVRAQYGPGRIGDELVPAYRQEEGVAEDSDVETFAAVRFHIDNWRWQGVPFLLRTGKRLPGRFSEIAIRFRRPPQNLFNRDAPELAVNDMVFRLQPDEGMSLSMNAKQPGLTTRLRPLIMDAPYAMAGSSMPEAYETLLHDVILGEAEMFSRADEVEASWRIVDPILTAWGESGRNIPHYPAGSPLVPGADELMAGCEGGWRPLS